MSLAVILLPAEAQRGAAARAQPAARPGLCTRILAGGTAGAPSWAAATMLRCLQNTFRTFLLLLRAIAARLFYENGRA